MITLVVIQTSWFKDFIKTKAEEIINQNINGNINIEEIQGNFFTHIEIKGITTTFNSGEPLLNLELIRLKYSPIFLIKGLIHIDEITFDHPHLYLSQRSDSSWNVIHFLKQKQAEKEDSTKTSFMPKLRFNSIKLIAGEFEINSTDTIIPKKIENLNIHLSGNYVSNNLNIDLKEFYFTSHRPDFKLNNLTFNFETNFSHYIIKDFNIVTALNHLHLDGNYEDDNNLNSDLSWPSIETKEFAFILPDFSIPGKPDFTLSSSVKNNTLQLDLGLRLNDESIHLNGKISDFSFTDIFSSILDLELTTKNLEPRKWLPDFSLPIILNSKIKIDGNGMKASTLPLKVSGNLNGSKWDDYLLQIADINISLKNKEIITDILMKGDFGGIKTEAFINLNGSEKPFNARFQSQDLALHKILPETLDSTSLSLMLNIEGKGIGSEDLSAYFTAKLNKSSIEYMDIDSLFLCGNFENQVLKIDSLTINNPSTNLYMKGKYEIGGSLYAKLNGDVKNTEAFNHYFDHTATWDKLDFSLTAAGQPDSLMLDLQGQSLLLKINPNLSINKLQFNINGLADSIVPNLKADISAFGIELSKHYVDTLTLNAKLEKSLWDAHVVSILPDDISIDLSSSGNLENKLEISLNSLNFNSSFSNLKLNQEPAIFFYSDSSAFIKNFKLSDSKYPDFALLMEGQYQKDNFQNLNLDIKNLNLELFSKLGFSERLMKGLANIDLSLGGEKEQITLKGNLSLNELEADPLAITEIVTDISYPGEILSLQSKILNKAGDTIKIDATTALFVSLSDSLLISWPKKINAKLQASKTQLSGFFMTLPGFDQPKALMTIDMEANGSLENPELKGYIDIINGEMPLAKYGINYKDIRLKLSLDGTKIKLDSLFTKHEGGTILAQGELAMDSSITSGRLKSSNLQINANNFYITKHHDHEIQINAKVSLKDFEKSPAFDGNIEVLRSSFNIPAILKLADGGIEQNEPLLIQSIKDRSMELEFEKENSIDDAKSKHRKLGFMDQLTGTLKLKIPRNSWIRSPDMQMELYGDIDIVKNSDIFELFGVLGVHRGFYTLYGKKLNILEGDFNFTGGEEFDPAINLKAEYIFRTPDRIKKKLKLLMSGKLSDPEFNFEIENENISEQDAMAYLLFGQTFDELSFSNQQGVNNNIPSKLITGMVSAQLSRTLGSTLGFDMVEIDAGDNWQNTTFMLGKYITNNLFVTYQKSFGQSGSDAISPEAITLEYELSRRLSFRLMQGEIQDSGVDIILKFEK